MPFRPLRGLVLGAAVLATAAGSALAPPSVATFAGTRTDAVLAWNANAGDAALAACIAPADNPLHESRMYAMTHIAIHDALNAIDRRFRPYAYFGVVGLDAGDAGLDAFRTERRRELTQHRHQHATSSSRNGSVGRRHPLRDWRPVTAIREAANDGNPRTIPDPTWTPLVTTPPIPDYDSAHAVEGGAAAAVLARVLGDRVSFTACSLTLPVGGCHSPNAVLRHFDSFSEAAAENAVSRIYVGFHFRDAVETGMEHGDRIGSATVKNVLGPA